MGEVARHIIILGNNAMAKTTLRVLPPSRYSPNYTNNTVSHVKFLVIFKFFYKPFFKGSGSALYWKVGFELA